VQLIGGLLCDLSLLTICFRKKEQNPRMATLGEIGWRGDSCFSPPVWGTLVVAPLGENRLASGSQTYVRLVGMSGHISVKEFPTFNHNQRNS